MFRVVSAATLHRRLLVFSALTLYGLVFACFALVEVPGLGLGHFFYVPIVLIALALGLRAGVAGAALATGLYALAIVVTPRLPTRDVLTFATAIRFMTYTTVGTVIGWYADQHRLHIDRLRELADQDFLTGLSNARVFDEALARRCAHEQRFAIVLVDMDELKRINDAHGHAEGNRAIRHVGEALGANVPPGADVARVGGDEFALLIDGSVPEVQALCGDLTRVLARDAFEVSFGWAVRPEDGESSIELFRKADDRLYAAKLLARNRRTVVPLPTAAHS
jgi:diguanylate cyclase (GGDEF)-like protein